MKFIKYLLIPAVLGVVFAIGFNYIDKSTETEAQGAKSDSKPLSVAWKAREIPIEALNSTFTLDLPAFEDGQAWIIAFNPTKVDKPRMFVESVNWTAPKDSLDFSRAVGAENISADRIQLDKGRASLGAAVGQRSANPGGVMILVEAESATKLNAKIGDRVVSLDSVRNVVSSFDTEPSKSHVPHVAILLTEFTTRKATADSAQRGFRTTRTDKSFSTKEEEHR